MASPSVTPGGVTEGAPPAGVDPLSRATTPVAGQTHDIVLGGVGFTLYRGNEDTLPSKVYTSEAVDYTFSPTFVDRSNTSGDWGDDSQDFFMSMTQKSWAGGEGRQFFRRNGGDDAYYAGENIMPTLVPGQVRRMGGVNPNTWSGGTQGAYENCLYVKGTGQIGGTNDPGDTLVRVSGTNAITTILEYSTDGGATWTTQLKTGATIWQDCIDMCMGDDGNIYFLEGSKTATQCMVHTFKGPTSGSTVAWVHWTATTKQANCICYFQGGVYLGDSAGRLVLATSAGGAATVIKDFGGGVILDLLSTPEGIYALYLSPIGTYKVFLYASGNTTEVLNLPRGWRLPYWIEAGVMPDRTASGIFAMHTDAICWSEGILYITGLMPARDQQQGRLGEARYRSALYYYSAGNSGFIWEAEGARNEFTFGSGAITEISDGIIAWADTQNDRLMAYDPRTGGVFCLLGSGTDVGLQNMGGNATGTNTNTLTANNTGTTISIASITHPLPGTVLRNSTQNNDERASAVGTGNFAENTFPYTMIRGFNFTTPQTVTFQTIGDTIATVQSVPWPITRLVFDFTNYTLTPIYQTKDFSSTISYQIRMAGSYWWYQKFRDTDVGALDAVTDTTWGAQRHSWLQSSAFDFESSLSKYFRSVQADFDTISFPLRSDEAAGLVHAWYKLDGFMSRPFDPYFRPSDLVAINTSTASITQGTTQTAGGIVSIVLAAGHQVQVGSILYGAAGASDESAIVTAVTGNTITLNSGRQYMGKMNYMAGYLRSATAFATGAVITVQNPITSGTRYNINATGKQMQVMLAFVAGATSSTVPISMGPILRKLTVRAAPIQPGFREREYQIAMFNDQPRMSQQNTAQRNVPKETRTPAELRVALETLVRAGTPINVSDGSMTNVLCVIEPDKTKLRELRAGEFVAFVTVKEI